MNEVNKNTVAVVFGAMRERCFYRARDIAEETGVSVDSARYALKVLAGGGVLEMINQRPSKVFASKQRGLPLPQSGDQS